MTNVSNVYVCNLGISFRKILSNLQINEIFRGRKSSALHCSGHPMHNPVSRTTNTTLFDCNDWIQLKCETSGMLKNTRIDMCFFLLTMVYIDHVVISSITLVPYSVVFRRLWRQGKPWTLSSKQKQIIWLSFALGDTKFRFLKGIYHWWN